jgi:membrane fusion protein, multidrug efflux system
MEAEIKENKLKEESTPTKRPFKLMILAVLVLVAAFVGLRAWLNGKNYETTDNAQVDAAITSVKSAVSGFVREVRFTDNQSVKKGDTLIIIDRRDYEAKVFQAKALLQSAESQTGVSRINADAAASNATATSLNASAMQASIDAAKVRLKSAEQELTRTQKMVAEGAATRQQLDANSTEYQSARVGYELALKQYTASNSQSGSVQISARAQKGQIGVSSALVQQRLAELQLAQSQLEYTVIVAPFDGLVSKKTVEVGQLLQAGQPVCSEVETDNLWIVANFKETQLQHIAAGKKANIELDAYPSLKLTGSVESIGSATGSKFSLLPPDNATGNFVKVTQRIPVRIKLDKIESPKVILQPGLSANVEIKAE